MLLSSLHMLARVAATTDPRHLAKFACNFGIKGARSVLAFRRRMKRGDYFPPFLYLSILNSCNLRCQGCWVDVDRPMVKIDIDQLNRTVREAKARGNAFFGILGGEPFLHPGLFDLLEAHPDCFFQIFTNGQPITAGIAERLRELGNATPLVSIEGTEVVSDQRRGRADVLSRSLRGLDNCLDARLLTGVATSVCRSNIDDLVNEDWLRHLIARGVHYVWYHTYRPVGPDIHHELALDPDQARRVREFVVEMRAKLPVAIIDAYYDGEGRALCPMATGISHHVSPTGAIEPCPIIQFATGNIADGDIYETVTRSQFLRDFRETAARNTRGCIVLERPDLVEELARRHGAADTTLRGTALAELRSMTPRNSQWMPTGEEIPEKHIGYRLAKRWFFSDFGAYSELGTGPGEGRHPGGEDGARRADGSTCAAPPADVSSRPATS